MASGEKETLQIPASMRVEVDARDGGICRFCGQFVGGARALHHARFGGGDGPGMGGRRIHEVGNLVTVGWFGEHDCHSILHGRKLFWLPYVLRAIESPGVTVLQLRRWEVAAQANRVPNRYEPWTLEEAEARFWSRTEPLGECLIFENADPGTYNYGQFRSALLERERGKPNMPIRAHHAAWRFLTGAWPVGSILHTCDRPGCVKGEHLYEADQAQNMRDRQERKPRHGEANPAAKLTQRDVDEMREAHAVGVSQATLVSEYGVSSASVSRIITGKTWSPNRQDGR